jgi:hypothetical protein
MWTIYICVVVTASSSRGPLIWTTTTIPRRHRHFRIARAVGCVCRPLTSSHLYIYHVARAFHATLDRCRETSPGGATCVLDPTTSAAVPPRVSSGDGDCSGGCSSRLDTASDNGVSTTPPLAIDGRRPGQSRRLAHQAHLSTLPRQAQTTHGLFCTPTDPGRSECLETSSRQGTGSFGRWHLIYKKCEAEYTQTQTRATLYNARAYVGVAMIQSSAGQGQRNKPSPS